MLIRSAKQWLTVQKAHYTALAGLSALNYLNLH